MDGFARRKEQSKEEIRRAAWELFSQFGVEKVSMTDIANKAGVSQATIYNNFGSKESLVREFVTVMVEGLVSRAVKIVSQGNSYQEKMAAFFQFISTMMADERPSPSGSAVFSGNLDLQNDPEIKEMRMKAQEQMIALLLNLIKEGKHQGQVDERLSDEALRIYLKMFMDIFVSHQFQHQYYRDRNLVNEMSLLMLHGLGGRNS
jgi:AcrR family transcriptional regulator